MTAIRNILKIDDLRPYLRAHLMRTGESSTSRGRFPQQVYDAVSAHLYALSATGRLEEAPEAEGHRIAFVMAWNRLADGSCYEQANARWAQSRKIMRQSHARDIARGCVKHLLLNLERSCALRPYDTEKLAFEALIHACETGTFIVPNADRCEVVGIDYGADFRFWVPHMFDLEDNLHIEPVLPSFARKALETKVSFPSGSLLVSDNLLFEAYIKEIYSAYPDGDKSDASRQFALHNLATSGIVQVRHVVEGVHLARETSDILNFATSRPSPAGDQPPQAEATPNARWKELNIIDRETLRSLIQAHRGCGVEQADEEIDAYLNAKVSDVTSLQVEPGTYHVYTGAHPIARLNEHDIEGVQTEGLDEVLVLSPHPLEVTPKPGTPIALEAEQQRPAAGM